jgi:probable HAF family extracellular repeat protein
MRENLTVWITAMTLLVGLANSTLVAAEQLAAQRHTKKHHHYIFHDVGTFGGPNAGIGEGIVPLNNRGTLVGGADTSIPNPNFANPNPFFEANPFIQRAFQWRKGILTDLGTLPGGHSSAAIWVNERGEITGISENGQIDPLLGTAEAVAVLWRDGKIINLGTLGGNESFPVAVNNRGQVVGMAQNAIEDPFSFAGFGTQTRAFLWENGVMRDLGDLGGPDSWAFYVNDRGQVAGFSYTSSLNIDPFFWENGKMQDLGSFGGSFGFANGLNSRGQVAGFMNLAGDLATHPFLWDRGKLTDLGTFGGTNGFASWLNDAGEVVGVADYPIACTGCGGSLQVYRPFVWRNGVMTDLGVVEGDRCGAAYSINSQGQVVGYSGVCQGGVHAFLWEDGDIMDLNTLIPANSGLQLVIALSINDRGEIAGLGVPPGVSVYDVDTASHVFLLTPVQDEDETASTTTLSQSYPAPVIPNPHLVSQGTLSANSRPGYPELNRWWHPGSRAAESGFRNRTVTSPNELVK